MRQSAHDSSGASCRPARVRAWCKLGVEQWGFIVEGAGWATRLLGTLGGMLLAAGCAQQALKRHLDQRDQHSFCFYRNRISQRAHRRGVTLGCACPSGRRPRAVWLATSFPLARPLLQLILRWGTLIGGIWARMSVNAFQVANRPLVGCCRPSAFQLAVAGLLQQSCLIPLRCSAACLSQGQSTVQPRRSEGRARCTRSGCA